MVVLYSNDCPKCKVLKSKLDNKKIEYDISDNMSDIINAGFLSVPILKLNNEYMEFSKAVEWVNSQE